jgi:cold shock CspA family protein
MKPGKIRWFNTKARYGFLRPDGAPEDGSGDVLITDNLLARLCITELVKNQPIRFDATQTRKGLRATALTIL